MRDVVRVRSEAKDDRLKPIVTEPELARATGTVGKASKKTEPGAPAEGD
jgi:hypothetical protein